MRAAASRQIAAPAKINLSLHVVGQRADGYHLLDGLVAFTACGDALSIEPANADALVVAGPFARDVPTSGDNLVLRALDLVRRIADAAGCETEPLRLTLTKYLPVASGLGGGSADAAALLHDAATQMPELARDIHAAAATLGADVPMCLRCRPSRSRGIGDRLDDLALPALDLLLVNPRVPVSTPAIFRRLASRENPEPPALPASGFVDAAQLVGYLARCRNDLEAPAMALEPAIGLVRDTIFKTGASLVRMSGSGATVFGIYDNPNAANEAAARMDRDHAGWWSMSTRTIPARPEKADDDR